MTVRNRLKGLLAALGRSYWHGLHRVPFLVRRVLRCPICGGEADFEARNTLFALRRCRDCCHVFTATVPGRLLLSQVYRGMHYWTLDKEHQGIRTIGHGPEWEGFIKPRMKAVAHVGLTCDADPGKDVYEIGCSEGMLVAHLQECGHRVKGCDLNRDIVAQGVAALGIDIVASWFEELPLGSSTYDVVLAFHTLEHLVDPVSVMSKVVDILRPDGSMLVEVPGGEEEYGNLDHLHFFTEGSLRRLLEHEFEGVEILENAYVNSAGVRIVSYYGVGRGVRSKVAADPAP